MFAKLQLIIEGILIPCISIFGLIGNIFSIIVLRSHGLDMKVGFFVQVEDLKFHVLSGHIS